LSNVQILTHKSVPGQSGALIFIRLAEKEFGKIGNPGVTVGLMV